MQCKWWSSAAILVGMLFVAVQANAAMITYDLDLQDTGGGIIEASAPFAPAQVFTSMRRSQRSAVRKSARLRWNMSRSLSRPAATRS